MLMTLGLRYLSIIRCYRLDNRTIAMKLELMTDDDQIQLGKNQKLNEWRLNYQFDSWM